MVPFVTMLLQTVGAICAVCLAVMMIYQLVLSFFGFGRKEKDYQDHDPESRFLVLVPAHNEEKVIGDIVHNLQQMDYPKELYDFYIIADNCTDRTAETARELGAKVIETCKEGPDSPTGKPIALRKALLSLGDYQNRYDLMMIFDADNLMDTNMFREVNSQYLDKGKPDFIQCYLGCKNKNGPIAWIDYSGFTLSNRFFQLGKHRLGINCGIGGTGFAMSTQYLYERGGWTTRSLTEDFEIQVEATMEGRRILWNHNTRVYDEKPTQFKASLRQKNRWGQGRWYVTIHETGNLFRCFLKGRISVWEFMSVLTHMYTGSVYLIVIIQSLCTGILGLLEPGKAMADPSLGSTLYSICVFIYSFFFLFYYADWVDNGNRFSLKTLPTMIASFVANTIIGMVSQIYGLIKCRDQVHWAKTEHAIDAAQTIHGAKTIKLPPKAA